MVGLARTVLLLSDEAVAVYTVSGGRYDMAGEISWQDPDLTASLAQMLRRQGRGHSVMILYDLVEQYYRKEMVPKVAVLDQQNVLARKLAATFPNYPIRGALPLVADKDKAKKKKSDGGQGQITALGDAKPYLFAAMPNTDQMMRVIESVRTAMVAPTGLYLLPIESVSMVDQLSVKLNKGKSPGRWTIFLAQHRGGGLRQIVVRDGELALTRLTPVVDTDIEPQLWANEVAQEFAATMGYLSRFGYTTGADLEVIAIGGTQALKHLEDQITVPSFHGLSVNAAARLLSLRVKADDAMRYGDLLHVAWLAKKLKFVMPFKSGDLSFISRVRYGGIAATWIALLLAVGALGYAGMVGYGVLQSTQELDQKKRRLVALEEEYNAEIERKKEYNIDVKLVQGSIAIHDKLEQNRIDIIEFLQKVATSLPSDLKFDAITMGYTTVQEQNPDPMAVGIVTKKIFEAKLELSFPGTFKPEAGNKVVSDLRDTINKNLPGFDAAVTQSVKDLTYNSEFSFETGPRVQSQNTSAQRLNAVITIKAKQNDQSTGI